jgi:hypothetical protein
MTLQINYQPSAMLLGQMAQSAGKSEYNRWLQGFNQQKSQSIANAFMGGFTQMGLPMAQMQSRENMLKQQIAAKGQASAAKAMQGLKWKDSNLPLLRDMHADRMHSRYGATWAEDPNLLQEWNDSIASMNPEDSRTAVNDWMFRKRQDTGHSLVSNPSFQRSQASGRYADAVAGSQPNPAHARVSSNIDNGAYKPETQRRMRVSLDKQASKNANPAGRPQTKYEHEDENVTWEQMPNSDMVRQRTRDPKTGNIKTEMFDVKKGDRETLDKLYDDYAEFTQPPSSPGIGLLDLDAPQKRAREQRARSILKRIRFYEDRLHPGIHGDTSQSDAEDLKRDVKLRLDEWNELEGFGGETNETIYAYQKEGGTIDQFMTKRGVDREEDLPEQDWIGMGMTGGRPHKAPETPSQKEESTKRKTEAGLQSMKDPSGVPPSLAEQSLEASRIGFVEIDRGGGRVEKKPIMGNTRAEIEGMLSAQQKGLPDPDTYVFENGELRQMSKPEIMASRNQAAQAQEQYDQWKALEEEKQSKEIIFAQGMKEAIDTLSPEWESGQETPVGWVKMQSSGRRAEGGPPIREWIVPSPKLMETFRDLEALTRTDMIGKYNNQIRDEKQGIKSAQGRDSLDRINALWKAYINNMWEPPTRGIPEKDKEREVLLRTGSAAAIWLGYMDKDPDNVIEKFMAFARDPKGQAIPKELHEIADAYRVLAASGVFEKPGMDFRMGGSLRPGM